MNKYKVGDKIVLTVTGTAEMGYFPRYVLNDNFNLWKKSIDELVEPLSTYTEPLEAKIRRQAAEITRLVADNKRLKAENGNGLWNIEQARAEGQNEAWELAQKIASMKTQEAADCFPEYNFPRSTNGLLNDYTYTEAAAKVEAWEKAKEEIKVGDVVKCEGSYGVITEIGTSTFSGIRKDSTVFHWYKVNCTKTGRHIDIDSFLKQIGEE